MPCWALPRCDGPRAGQRSGCSLSPSHADPSCLVLLRTPEVTSWVTWHSLSPPGLCWGPQLSGLTASNLPEGGVRKEPCFMWKSQVAEICSHPQPLAEPWRQGGQGHLPLLLRHGGWRCPPSVLGYSWLQKALPTHTNVVPRLPTLLEEQLKLLAFVHPGKGT